MIVAFLQRRLYTGLVVVVRSSTFSASFKGGFTGCNSLG